jgi:hypothetical protein
VFFLPEGMPGVEQSETETVADSGTLADTPTGGDVSIDATGNHIITTAKYEGNPGGIPTFEASGNYYDVHLDNDINVNSLTIEFSPAIEDTTIFYWDGAIDKRMYRGHHYCLYVPKPIRFNGPYLRFRAGSNSRRHRYQAGQ